MKRVLGQHPATALEIAAEYQDAGLWADGTAVLLAALRRGEELQTLPLACYDLAFFAARQGDEKAAARYRALAAAEPAGPVFPFQSQNLAVLREAMQANPGDARAAVSGRAAL